VIHSATGCFCAGRKIRSTTKANLAINYETVGAIGGMMMVSVSGVAVNFKFANGDSI